MKQYNLSGNSHNPEYVYVYGWFGANTPFPKALLGMGSSSVDRHLKMTNERIATLNRTRTKRDKLRKMNRREALEMAIAEEVANLKADGYYTQVVRPEFLKGK